MRLSLLNYDKVRRCPTWSGPSLYGPNPKYEDSCHNGFIPLTKEDGYMKPLWKFRFFQCPECKVVTLPYYVLALTPSVIWFKLTGKIK